MSSKKLIVDENRCKSCGLCVEFCPKKTLEIGSGINVQGYNFVVQKNKENCIGCDTCGIICPDMAIGVIRTAPITQ